MQPRRVDAGRGIAWLSEGWTIFKRDPGMWIALIIVWGVIQLVLGMVPVVGVMLSALLGPALGGGLMFAAREGAEGRPLDINHLFAAFRDESRRNPMLVLGTILVVFNIVMLVVFMIFVGGSMAMMGQPHYNTLAAGMGIGMLLVLLVFLCLGLLVTMALLYAVPLVMFTDTPPMAAMKSSFAASMVDFMPLLVFSIFYLLLALLAAIPLGLGFLLLLPVTVCAIYASYRDIYPPEQPA